MPRDAGEHRVFLYYGDLAVNEGKPIMAYAESDSPIGMASTSKEDIDHRRERIGY